MGLATMALLEWLSPEETVLPTVKDYRESIHEFMRKAKMPNNKSSKSILAALEDPAEYDKEVAGSWSWPAVESQMEERETGEYIVIFEGYIRKT